MTAGKGGGFTEAFCEVSLLDMVACVQRSTADSASSNVRGYSVTLCTVVMVRSFSIILPVMR